MSFWLRRAVLGFAAGATLWPSACSDQEQPPLTPFEDACLRYCRRLAGAAEALECEGSTPSVCFADCASQAARCSLPRLQSLVACVEALPETAFACLTPGDPAIVSSACDDEGALYERSCSRGAGGSEGSAGDGGEAGTHDPPAGAGGAAGSADAVGGAAGAAGAGGPECVGSVAPCSSLGAGELCNGTLGCQTSNACSGTAEACESLSGSGPCESQLGCTWEGGCTGVPEPCSNFVEETPCLAQSGCDWVFACGGSAVSCADVGVEDCGLQPGCAVRRP